MKSRVTAIILCWFLGIFGVHKFYLGQTGWGVAYLLFFWTGIPFIGVIIDFFSLVFMSDADFNVKFNGKAGTEALSAKDATTALADLKKLYDDGVITAEEYEEKRKKLLSSL